MKKIFSREKNHEPLLHVERSGIDALADVGQNTSITRINEKLSAFDTWSTDDIEKRQMMLINLAHEIWQTTAIEG
ncbi:MAG: hypothetical protein HOC33_05095 [Alphaproteobacteria bacterium]|jgi:hypothetical protein|nr:hypothetical protein [Alphaproteobacteria bacterium]MBT4543203.1 hypothetical protein [Alphaproteobacteria bacterium]MBT6242623.1 hypothetical protein [Rhodospirillaceae bacterium]MBT7580042.1 hypothetical protein [Candidatus Neomarinimicrobiota bacterium]